MLGRLFIFAWATLCLPSLAFASWDSCPSNTASRLELFVSRDTTIASQASTNQSRWSDYEAPVASLYVKVARESDVGAVIKFANLNNYEFLVQNGGNGWATTFNLGKCSLIIDISGLNSVTFNQDKTRATIQGGVRVKDLVTAAAGNNTRIATATCNCVAFLGAALGGGLTRTSGLYGMGVDQLIVLNVVLASGDTIRVNANSHPDLWYALRGAAPNIGVVTSAVIQAYPIPAGQNIAWQGTLVYTADQLEAVLTAISNLYLAPRIQVDFTYVTSGAPDYTPLVGVVPFFIGNASEGEAAFASLLEIGPVENTATEVPYESWNAAGDSFCTRGPRKPTYGAAIANIDVPTWKAVFDEFTAFVNSNQSAFGGTAVLAESYPTQKSLEIGDATSSYPYRDLARHVIVIPAYTDPSHDADAVAFASKIRDMWWATGGTTHNSSYINFAHGDETLPTIYGSSLNRLQSLKKIYDPFNRFNQWFPLTTGW